MLCKLIQYNLLYVYTYISVDGVNILRILTQLIGTTILQSAFIWSRVNIAQGTSITYKKALT